MQTDNFLLKCCLLLELGHVILYFFKLMNNHDNNNHILDVSHCHVTFKIISENVSWDLLLQKGSGSTETFFLDTGEHKFVRIQILMKYFKDVSKTLGGDQTAAFQHLRRGQ